MEQSYPKFRRGLFFLRTGTCTRDKSWLASAGLSSLIIICHGMGVLNLIVTVYRVPLFIPHTGSSKVISTSWFMREYINFGFNG